jgi:Flp pilus assembly protein TadG
LRRGSRHNWEQGVVITLVAVFMLVVVGAMAALSIDVVTFYTARSEAQLAADSAALAAARVLANSAATSDSTGTLMALAQTPAQNVALQVAGQNQVGGMTVASGQVTVTVAFNVANPTDPTVTVTVQVPKLPTFFARMLGTKFVAVAAWATAEAYNPTGTGAGGAKPVAPTCVKPWLLPNKDPSNGGKPIFDTTSGAVTGASNLLGWYSTLPATPLLMDVNCPGGDCSGALPAPSQWQYYPGNDDPTSFPHPTNSLPTCSLIPTLTDYQKSVVGCVQTSLACNSNKVNIDLSPYTTRTSETADAVNCLTHATVTGGGDTVTSTTTTANPPTAPFEFIAGAGNPIPGLVAGTTRVMVSDSLVTVPVFDSTATTNPVQIIGFVQLFLNPAGSASATGINTTVINLAGCGTGAIGTTPIYGNGASPVAVRLISSP